MDYRFPTIKDEDIISDYIKEHYDNNEMEIYASNDVSQMSYCNWIEKIEKNRVKSDKIWGKSLIYLAFNKNNKLIGMVSIRYELSEEMRMIYGNIGYGVRTTERRKGYATEMLKFALDVCKKKSMKKAVIGCYKDNIASSKIIEKNGGIKIKEKDFNGKLANYYEINL